MKTMHARATTVASRMSSVSTLHYAAIALFVLIIATAMSLGTANAASGDTDNGSGYANGHGPYYHSGGGYAARDHYRPRARHYREHRRERRHARRAHRAHRDYYRGHRRHHRRHRSDGDVVAGAIIGFAVGAIIADSYNRSYNAPPSRTHYNRVPARSHAPEPFTDEWYRYCDQKYRSFDWQTGTFQPYNGPRRLCR